MKNSLFDIVNLFLSKQKLQFDEQALRKHLFSHPYVPSLLSLTQTLSEFGILATVLYSDWDILQTCKQPVLLHVKEKDETLVIFEAITEGAVCYRDGNGALYREDKNTFLAKWDGILVVTEPANKEKQAQMKKKSGMHSFEKIMLGLSVMVLVGITMVGSGVSDLFFWIFFILKCMGCVVSYFLVKHALGLVGKLDEKVCHMGKSTDCNAVLTSPAAKLFKTIGMSDIGVVYFSGGLLALFVSALSQTWPILLGWLSVLSFCTVPYTLFSLYYQRWVVKKWCPFCLTVIALLWGEAFTGYFVLSRTGFVWSWVFFFGGVFLFLFLSVAWSRCLSGLKRIIELQNAEFECFKWKKNDEVFYLQWQNQPELPLSDRPGTIMLGDPQAGIRILAVVGLRCNPCAKEYHILYHLLAELPEDFQVELHLASGSAEEEVYVHLLSLYKECGGEVFASGLKEWYTSFDAGKLYRCFPVKNGLSKAEKEEYTVTHRAWEKKYGIDRTPAVFVNDRRLPVFYQVNDLRYFTETLSS